jgi:hypothetical protein
MSTQQIDFVNYLKVLKDNNMKRSNILAMTNDLDCLLKDMRVVWLDCVWLGLAVTRMKFANMTTWGQSRMFFLIYSKIFMHGDLSAIYSQ